MGSIPGLGRGNGNPLQYSCLKSSRDRGAWRAIVQRVAKESDPTERLSTHTNKNLGIFHFSSPDILYLLTYFVILAMLPLPYVCSGEDGGGDGSQQTNLFHLSGKEKAPQKRHRWPLLIHQLKQGHLLQGNWGSRCAACQSLQWAATVVGRGGSKVAVVFTREQCLPWQLAGQETQPQGLETP